MKLPPLKALTYFNAAASQASFKAAASQLSVTEGAVSRQIKRLEDYFGHALFERAGRGVRLTSRGEKLFSVSTNALQKIADVSAEIREVDTQLKLAVTTSFAIRWLMPKLIEFETLFPEYPVNLHAEKGIKLSSHSSFDTRIIYQLGNPFQDVNTAPEHSEFIMAEWLQPMCSPALLKHGKPLSSAKLKNHKIILNEPTGRDWKVWLKSNPGTTVNFDTALRFEHDDTAIQAAVAGHGIALANRAYIEKELENNLLVPAIDVEPLPIGAHYIISMPNRYNSPVVKAFRQWLLSKAGGGSDS